ncbi:Uncharacterised protein [Mycobacteroides abscessus subsp. abscessus]|uniref:hypothetical protein n=1 Tax=Mycobacteroides abscessus TaxID=36809 RepID=UPI0009A8AC93|nr:hypothetical protein [Mycobacteroides abscessus]SKU76805.1 Uncharacterised protein [Mycobacteroides abscessus subsp. abscessus]SKX97762.1 Uncharacterised protein [Mycobacteroides abscessus subsp. abscessus]
MTVSKITHGLAVGAVVAGALALTACGSDKSEASSIEQLGTPIHVSGEGPGWNGEKFAGTLNVTAGPVCSVTNGGRVLVFHVNSGADKGAIPTATWQLQTGNVRPVANGDFDLGNFAGPLLGPVVDNGHAWGDIAFYVPGKTVATVVELFAKPETYSSGPGDRLAAWATQDNVEASAICPTSVQTAVESAARSAIGN